MTITLKNYGVAPATAISGLLSSPGTGVTVATPNKATFPNLPPARVGRQRRTVAVHDDRRRRLSRSSELHFVANYTGGTGPLPQPFAVPIGVTPSASRRTSMAPRRPR